MTIIVPKSSDYLWPRTGVAAAVLTPRGYVLMRRAPGKHGAGTWALPGGALERGERLVDCACREVLEEIGVVVRDAALLPLVTEDLFPESGQHWLTHYVLGRTDDEPANLEPAKCDGLFVGWPDEFPGPFFVGLEQLLAQGLLPPRGW